MNKIKGYAWMNLPDHRVAEAIFFPKLGKYPALFYFYKFQSTFPVS